jgi:hypothetical protein
MGGGVGMFCKFEEAKLVTKFSAKFCTTLGGILRFRAWQKSGTWRPVQL